MSRVSFHNNHTIVKTRYTNKSLSDNVIHTCSHCFALNVVLWRRWLKRKMSCHRDIACHQRKKNIVKIKKMTVATHFNVFMNFSHTTSFDQLPTRANPAHNSTFFTVYNAKWRTSSVNVIFSLANKSHMGVIKPPAENKKKVTTNTCLQWFKIMWTTTFVTSKVSQQRAQTLQTTQVGVHFWFSTLLNSYSTVTFRHHEKLRFWYIHENILTSSENILK